MTKCVINSPYSKFIFHIFNDAVCSNDIITNR